MTGRSRRAADPAERDRWKTAAVGPDNVGQELRIPAILVGVVGNTAHSVGRRGDEAIAVGEDGVPVDPVPLIVDQMVRVEFSGGDDVVAQIAVVVAVAVDGQLSGKY